MSALNYLDAELARASFNVEPVRHMLHGGKQHYDNYKKWHKLFDIDLFDTTDDAFLTREDRMRLGVKRALASIDIMKKNKDLLAAHSPVHGEGGLSAGRITGNHSGVSDHFALFVSTIMSQGSPDQVRTWLPKALNLEILGTYAQTELGHGTNVRGLETTATFDPTTDQFTVNMPEITAMKWWPGGLGLLSTHAIIYARLIVKEKDLGYHAFMVQIRDEHHKALPGIEVGDIGPKMGNPALDSGYLYIRNVQIPRFHMFARFQQLSKDGTYTPAPAHLSKIAYMTMMKTRVMLSLGAAYALAKGLTVALRYNAFRKQGFIDSKKGRAGGEMVILDYPVQQWRLVPLIATSWAIAFAGFQLRDILTAFEAGVKAAGKDVSKIDTSMLPELHATSAGLKAFGTEAAINGIEEARRCCGGQGYALSSGIAQHAADYLPAVTYEGDRLPMALQTARALVGVLAGRMKAEGSFAYLKDADDVAFSEAFNLPHLLGVLATCARRAVAAAGQVLMEGRGSGLSADAAWNAAHVPLFTAASIHTQQYMLRCFVKGLDRVPEAARPAFSRLAMLFGLTKLGEISCEFSHMTPAGAKVIDEGVRKLLSDLRPDVVALIESWGISDRQLGSCIARSDGKIYEAVYAWAQRSPLNRPAYVEQLHKETIGKHVNRDLLRQGAAKL